MREKRSSFVLIRPASVFAFLCILFLVLIIRIRAVGSMTLAGTAAAVTEKYVSLGTSRGYIYDRKMRPLVNNVKKNMAVMITSPVTEGLLPDTDADLLSARDGLLICRETPEKITETDISVNIPLVERYSSERLCSHLIGYTDGDGKGVCGIEKAFDRILYEAKGAVGVRYDCDVFGRALLGEKLSVVNDNYDSAAGVMLTVDAEIQSAAEKAMKESCIEKGACVVLDAETGAILASVSVPDYDINDIAASLDDPDAPFMNRALNAYPVGSVFKPIVAAAAIESGTQVNGDFVCSGSIDAGGVYFHCYNRKEHGEEQLNEAICNSCNCYFIEKGTSAGGEKICDTASRLGFGKEIKLTSSMSGAAGILPDPASLLNPAAVANLCFGQGELLATPLQLAAAYAVFSSGGIYRQPYLTAYLIDADEKKYAYYDPGDALRVLDEGICSVINESLRLNMENGTGQNGAPDGVSSAGKTATAQTGRYDMNGTEQLCTWFCGFFPFEEPKYSVCVFNEDGTTASQDCAPVFKRLAEEIARMDRY